MAFESFTDEYAKHLAVGDKQTPAGVATGVLGLMKVLGSTGPERNHASALEHFRTVSLKFDEAAKMMEAAGLDPKGKGVPAEAGVKMAATLKFLRHLYMVSDRGNQQVWVLSTPKSYAHYPMDEFLGVKTSHAEVKARLADVSEVFPTQTRQRFGEAMMLGLAWSEAAKSVLSTASADAKSMAKVKRWFAESTTPQATLDKTIANLHAGFKKIANTLNSHQLIITDMPNLRSDPNHELTEAFILSGSTGSQRPRCIYIEKALFENYEISVLHDMKKNWARVLVHECTHIDAATDDKGYAYNGIQPGVDISAAHAAVNADSWAFFAADCANVLTAGEITRAFGGTGGDVVKQAANWT